MTAGWAALNTLRDLVRILREAEPVFRTPPSGTRWEFAEESLSDAVAALALVQTALEAADDAVANCLTVLAVTGSGDTGYHPSESTQTTYVALLEEWYAAALGVCDLDAALRAVREGK